VFQDADTAMIASSAELYETGAALQSGGAVGGFLGEWLGFLLYPVGTGLLAIPLLLIIGIYLIGMTPSGIWQRVSTKMKMASARRAERRREMYEAEEERAVRLKEKRDSSKEQDGEKLREEKKQERLEERVDYSFGEDEDEYGDEDHRTRRNQLKTEAEEKTDVLPEKREPEGKRTADGEECTEQPRSAADIVDIPDDLPEIEEEEAEEDDLDRILARAGHTESSEDKLEQILREVAEQSALAAEEEPEEAAPQTVAEAQVEAVAEAVSPEAPAATEERVLRGTSYSPFALHRHFESEQPAAEPAIELIVEEPAASENAQESDSYLTEGPLGSLNPIRREQKQAAENQAAQPAAAAEPALPVEEELAYRPVAPVQGGATREASVTVVPTQEAPRQVPLASGMSFAEDGTVAQPVSPVAQPAAPVAQPVAPVAQPVAPVAQPVAPVAQPTASVAQPVQEQASAVRFGGFTLDAEENEAPAAPVTQSAPRAEGVAFTREEVAQAPQPQRTAPAERVIPMAPRAQVLTKTEPVKDEERPAPPPPPREYRMPPLSLLSEDKSLSEDDHSEEDQQKIDILRRTLESFNVHIKDEVICSRGPTITRYEVRPEIGVPVRSIINRIDDITLYMEAQVRIAPIPGKAAVGVEVPNKIRQTVYLRTLLESDRFKKSKNPVEVALGVGIGGDIQMCDLTAMPHLLVAGATKSGKSVCINTIILSLLYKTSPRDLRLILIDPKRVEFKPYMHLPHLYAPIITEPARAVGALACAVQEMERRYTLLEDVGARNFEGYNEKVKNDPEREHLPYLVIIIDEYYDLKMACPNNDLENYACRLAQKARAAGIHLIIGTQRPSVNVITGTLKANIPSRIAFTVMQQVDSRTILDAVGAELLTGRGDMLYAPMGEKPIRLQGSFVSDDEVESVVNFVRDRNDPVQYNQAFMDQIEVEVARAANTGKKNEEFDEFADDADGDEDPKLLEAVTLAVQTQKVATSLLQRRLGVGYGRAAKIIDRMEELGLVTPAEGNKPRKLLPAAQGYLDHMANAAGDDMGSFGDEGEY
ncbi:MAG: hypothetical protein IKM08_05850, partial [Clostridia bacterium]|nr:hypothetical protein [Clostridia bacterium]